MKPLITRNRALLTTRLAFGAVALLLYPDARAAEIVGISPVARPIYPHMVGYNSDYYYTNNPWSLAKRRDAAVKSRPGMLRYPGGTSANYWDA